MINGIENWKPDGYFQGNDVGEIAEENRDEVKNPQEMVAKDEVKRHGADRFAK